MLAERTDALEAEKEKCCMTSSAGTVTTTGTGTGLSTGTGTGIGFSTGIGIGLSTGTGVGTSITCGPCSGQFSRPSSIWLLQLLSIPSQISGAAGLTNGLVSSQSNDPALTSSPGTANGPVGAAGVVELLPATAPRRRELGKLSGMAPVSSVQIGNDES